MLSLVPTGVLRGEGQRDLFVARAKKSRVVESLWDVARIDNRHCFFNDSLDQILPFGICGCKYQEVMSCLCCVNLTF